MSDPLAPLLASLDRDTGDSSDFDLNPDYVMPAGRKLRPAGVLIPIEMRNEIPHLILTKRASHLKQAKQHKMLKIAKNSKMTRTTATEPANPPRMK